MENSKDIKKLTPVIITEGQQVVIPDFEVDALARCLLPKMQAYFASTEGQTAFKQWQQQQKNT